ncbi:hypothetical protein WAF17_02785 [Bernardetia sp. ABR2-2B]|uniref:hypothetical protein n=1 Tax=Bernardetia sp. ABR2-2B TaxID=3127472 RepID=UPI0030D14347
MNAQSEKPEILKFIEERRPFLNIQGIEEGAKLPDKTLQKYLYGIRAFPKKHIETLENFCKQWLGYIKEK